MLVPVAAREVIAHEIGAVLERLEQASNDDWATQTRCTDWTVEDLARHIAWGQSFEAEAVTKALAGITDVSLGRLVDVNADRPSIVAAIRANHAELLAALDSVTEEQLGALCPIGYANVPIAFAVNIFAFEAGVHGNDLGWALGDERPLPADVITATAAVLGASWPGFAAAARRAPAGAIGYRLASSNVAYQMAWDGRNWSYDGDLPERTCRIDGDDSSILLFGLGRIPADHPSIGVSGARALVDDFKVFFPGP
jgi:uncharacterized protein (TIGR03083 family)